MESAKQVSILDSRMSYHTRAILPRFRGKRRTAKDPNMLQRVKRARVLFV